MIGNLCIASYVIKFKNKKLEILAIILNLFAVFIPDSIGLLPTTNIT